MEILKSKEPSNIDFSIIKDNSLPVSLLEIMIDLAIKDGEVHENEIEYILNFCDKMNIDKKSTLERLKTNN